MLKGKLGSVLHNKALLAVMLVALITAAAFTVAWAASIGTYDQCSNDLGVGYGPPDEGCRWVNGNLQANNSLYAEGDATVQRVWLTDYAPGTTHTITFTYGTTKAGKHAYDFLTTWDWSENWITDADRCQDITGCLTAVENISPVIPTDPAAGGFDVAAGSQYFTIRGGTISAVSTPTFTGSYAGDSETSITVTFTVASTGSMCVDGLCDVAIWFGAHVARTADWNPETGAGSIPGSPYHVALTALDGDSIGQRDNQMQSNAILAVSMANITAEAQAAGVVVAWETVSELDNAGFNIYRGGSDAGPWVKANAALVPAAAPGSAQGHLYSWTDTAAVAGQTYFYMLEDVALDGSLTRHAPVSVSVVGPNAVSLADFGATAATATPALVGLATVALAALAGVGLRRRR